MTRSDVIFVLMLCCHCGFLASWAKIPIFVWISQQRYTYKLYTNTTTKTVEVGHYTPVNVLYSVIKNIIAVSLNSSHSQLFTISIMFFNESIRLLILYYYIMICNCIWFFWIWNIDCCLFVFAIGVGEFDCPQCGSCITIITST